MMQRWKLAALAVLSVSVGAAAAFSLKERVPSIVTVQATYDAEVGAGSKLHDQNLRITQADCRKFEDKYRCFVSFVSIVDPEERLYYDVAEMSHSFSGWKLTSGLCKSRDRPKRS